MKNGPCQKCGGGSFCFEPIEIDPLLTLDIGLPTSNYCSKCGASLWQTCFSCNGTGKTTDFPIVFDVGPSYCSECGRSLKKKKKSNKCTSCGGKGKTRTHHICVKSPDFPYL